jgi:hypothetical protein
MKCVAFKSISEDLSLLRGEIRDVRDMVQSETLADLVRVSPGLLLWERPRFPERLAEIESQLASVRCYLRLRWPGDMCPPLTKTWFKDLCVVLDQTRKELDGLRVDVTFEAVRVLFSLGVDLASNAAFTSVYTDMGLFVGAAVEQCAHAIGRPLTLGEYTAYVLQVKREKYTTLVVPKNLTRPRLLKRLVKQGSCDTPEKATKYYLGKMQANLPKTIERGRDVPTFMTWYTKQQGYRYQAAHPMVRFIPGAASLGVSVLVEKTAAIAHGMLKRWERMHGLELPNVRRTLEVLAYHMPKRFEGGCYDLQSLLSLTYTGI